MTGEVTGWPETLAEFIGKVARPVAIIVTSVAAAWATIEIAMRVENGNDGAIFIGAVLTGVAVLYGAKAWEQVQASGHGRDVKVANATGTSPTPQQVVVKNTPADPVQVEETRPT